MLLHIAQDELKKKVELFSSMEASIEENLVQEHQLRVVVQQNLSETKSALEVLQHQFKQQEQCQLEKVTKYVNDAKQERHHWKLSEEIMKEMSSIIKTLQS
jgi:hypothetical protein